VDEGTVEDPEMDFSAVPVNRFFRYELVSRSDREATVRMQPREEFLQEEGRVQGGILSALADTAAVYVFFPDLPEEKRMTSVEFKVNFLGAALPGNGPLVARATVVRRGRRIGVCDVEVSQGRRVILKGLFTYLFYDRTPDETSS